MGNSVSEFWATRDAEIFDLNTQSSGRIKAIQQIAFIAKPYLHKPNAISVELGCGTGLFSESAGARSILGIDFSQSLLRMAQKRMKTVIRQDIFRLEFKEASIDNIISLFVIDDYPMEKKIAFFNKIVSFLKPGGYFFFAAYSPNDERMGAKREIINKQIHNSFEIYLEDISDYERNLQNSGFTIANRDVIEVEGTYETEGQITRVQREFLFIIAQKL